VKRVPLNIADYQKFVLEYRGESDRAAIVMAGSFVEHYLATYLRHFMIADEEVEVLFSRALSTFDSRINIAYAFDLIGKAQRDDLRIIKDVRNAFAHSPRSLSLQDPKISAQIKQLSIWPALEAIPEPTNVEKGERYIYLFSIGRFVLFTHQRMVEQRP
jgi:hypothetical protein